VDYTWTWNGGSATGVNPTIQLGLGTHEITLVVNDGEVDSDPDTVEITVVDTTPPSVVIKVPGSGDALQDGVTFTAEVSDHCEIAWVTFSIREPDGPSGTPIGYEDLPATFNASSDKWELSFDTTQLEDGYYVLLAKAKDNSDNTESDLVPFTIRNWAVVELLPACEDNKAGRTMPIKFSLRIVADVDPNQPFVHNEDLEIRIRENANPGDLYQSSLYGDHSRDYRIDTVGELYITNFKTLKEPQTYLVQIWRINKDFLVGWFTFTTTR